MNIQSNRARIITSTIQNTTLNGLNNFILLALTIKNQRITDKLLFSSLIWGSIFFFFIYTIVFKITYKLFCQYNKIKLREGVPYNHSFKN